MASIKKPKATTSTTKTKKASIEVPKSNGSKASPELIMSVIETGMDVVNQVFTTFNNITTSKTERIKIQEKTEQIKIQSNSAKEIKLKELDQTIRLSEEETKRFIEKMKIEMLKVNSETQIELEKLSNEQISINLKYKVELKRLEIFESLANKLLDQYNIYLNAYNSFFDTGIIIINEHELQDIKELRSQLTNLALSQAPSKPLLLEGDSQ